MRPRTWTEDQFVSAVASSTSIAGVLRCLGLHAAAANYRTVKLNVERMGLSTDHWTGQGHLKGKSHTWTVAIPLNEVMVENSTYGAGHLKHRLIKAGMLEDKCSECNLSEWRGRKLVVQIDHINGVSNDHRWENIRLLCPNCHSQTPTYCSRNRNNPLQKTPSKVYVTRVKKVCTDCSGPVHHKAMRCKSCAGKQPSKNPTRIVWPSVDDLRKKIALSNLSVVARELGVSSPSVKKHAKL